MGIALVLARGWVLFVLIWFGFDCVLGFLRCSVFGILWFCDLGCVGFACCYLVTWYTVVSAGLFGGGFRYLAVCWVSDLGVVADLGLDR